MIVIKYICFFSVLFLTGRIDPVKEQAVADFKKVNEAFTQTVFSVKMTYNFYKQSSDVKPYETKTGQYCKNGETSYSIISGVESIRTKTSTIAIQQEDKIMVISNAAKKVVNTAMSFAPDSLLRFCTSVVRTEPSTNQVKYELMFDKKVDVEFEKLEVTFDKKTYVVSKIAMYYPKQEVPAENDADKTEQIKPKMEVVYSAYSKVLAVDAAVFNEQYYVKLITPNTYKGIGKYTDYKVYNQKFK